MQSNTNSARNEGLQSIPWGTNQQAPPLNQLDYFASEKTIALERPEEKRICGVRKSRFILFMMLGVLALAITIIAAVVTADKRKSPSRVAQQDADASPQSTSTIASPSATSTRPATPTAERTVVLLSLDCTGNTTASIFMPRDGGVTKAFGFTASCGLDCAASNLFTFEKYDVGLCATTCAGKTDGRCGAMVFKYAGLKTGANASAGDCLLTTSCTPR